jgi:hypothetical protein
MAALAALSTRCVPLNGGNHIGTVGAGASARNYSGATVDATGDPVNGDSTNLVSQGFLPVCASGTTAQRPHTTGWGSVPGTMYLDLSLNQLILWNGSFWVSPITGLQV